MRHILLCCLVPLISVRAEAEFGNAKVVVRVEQQDMSWSVSWPEAQVKLGGIGFAVEVDGKTLKPTAPATSVRRDGDWTEVFHRKGQTIARSDLTEPRPWRQPRDH
ncbi:MAG TPA: hypothetical protein VLT36_03585 [Candidatus Dormibacteraeota bacterium]|nr:hypothetical protein [Candidatus Dormibacteraeota bacterium]